MFAPVLPGQEVIAQASKDDWEEINFEFNSAVLVDGFPSLLKMAEILKQHPEYKVSVVGHADQIGRDRYNERLGDRRAKAVRDFLVKYGATEGQVSVSTQGERNPKVAQLNKEARFMNRRVTLTVTDAQGRTVSVGDIGDALKAMKEAADQTAAAQRKCCDEILKRLDRLDEIADLLKKMTADNDALRKELAELRGRQNDLDSYVRGTTPVSTGAGPDTEARISIQRQLNQMRQALDDLNNYTRGLNLSNADAVQKQIADAQKQITDLEAYSATILRPLTPAETARLSDLAVAVHNEIADVREAARQGSPEALAKELAEMQKALADYDAYVRSLPKENPEALTTQQRMAAEIERARMPRYSTINLNAGADSNGDLTFTGRGRLFMPFREQFALQLQGEYLYFRDRQEGEFDFGLVNRFATRAQAGVFGSFKHVTFSDRARNSIFEDVRVPGLILPGSTTPTPYQIDPGMPVGSGLLGQASATLDYLFSRGRFGIFGAKGFLNDDVISRTAITRNLYQEFYIRTIDQVGLSTTLGLFGPTYLEANIGYLKSRGYADRPGGTARFVFPFSERFAFTLEGGMNETLLTRDNWGRVVAGLQFGNFQKPTDYLAGTNGIQHAVPADIPRVRYELLTRRVRTGGNDAPVADAGPDQTGVAAGTIQLDASGSFDPDGDPITFEWTQIAGPSVSISGQNTAQASFVAAEGQSYSFRVTVRDDKGAQGIARVTVSTATPETVQIVRFQASPSSIRAGQTSTIDWQVLNAEAVSISGIGDVPANGTRQVNPTETTQYTLTARNRAGEVTATTTIVVEANPRPNFTTCQVQPTSIVAGESANILWAAENAESVNISGIGAVAPSGTQPVSPTETTTYTITATGSENQTATCSVTLRVSNSNEAPRITSFNAAPMNINPGDTSILSWQVDGATSVTISPEVGEVNAAGGTRQVTPARTTTYTLTATNNAGTSTANVTVTVEGTTPGQNPTLENCAASPSTTARPGDPAVLSWTAANAEGLAITPFSGTPPVNGPVTVNPMTSTTYLLTATGAQGTTPASCSITVTVPVPEPPIAEIVGPDIIRTIYYQIELEAVDAGPGATYTWEGIGKGVSVLDQGQRRTRIQLPTLLGDYEIRLTVGNEAGGLATDTVIIRLDAQVEG
jgi:hypothetical protein